MAHRATFDKRIPIGLAVAGSLGLALYLGYKKYKSGAPAQDSPEGKDEGAKKDTPAKPATPVRPAAPASEPAKAKPEPPQTPPKPQVPKRQPEPPKPAAPEPKPTPQEPPKPAPKPAPEPQKPTPQEPPKPAPAPPKPAPQEPPKLAPEPPKPAPTPQAPPKPQEQPKPVPPPADPKPTEPSSAQKDAAASALEGSDPLVSLHSWGDLEDKFSTVQRSHSPSELDITPSNAKSDTNSNIVADQAKPSFPGSDSQAPQDLPSPLSLKSWGDLLSSGPQEIISPLRSLESSTYSLDSSPEVDKQDLHDFKDTPSSTSDDSPSNDQHLNQRNGDPITSPTLSRNANAKTMHPPRSPQETGKASTILKQSTKGFDKEVTIDIAQIKDFDDTDLQIPLSKLNSPLTTQISPATKRKNLDIALANQQVSEAETIKSTEVQLLNSSNKREVSSVHENDSSVRKHQSENLLGKGSESQDFAEVIVEDYFSNNVSSPPKNGKTMKGSNNIKKNLSSTYSVDSLNGNDEVKMDEEQATVLSHSISSSITEGVPLELSNKAKPNSIDNSYFLVDSQELAKKTQILDNAHQAKLKEDENDNVFTPQKSKNMNIGKYTERSDSVASVDSLDNSSGAVKLSLPKVPEPEVDSENTSESNQSEVSKAGLLMRQSSVNSNTSVDSLDNHSQKSSRSYADALKAGKSTRNARPSSADSNKTFDSDKPTRVIKMRPSSAGSKPKSPETVVSKPSDSGSKDSLDSTVSTDLNVSTSNLLSSPETTHYWSADKQTGEPSWMTRSVSRNSESCSSIDSLELRQRGEGVSSTEVSPFTTPDFNARRKVIDSDSSDVLREELPKPVVISLRWKPKLDEKGRSAPIQKEVVDLGMEVDTTTAEDGKFVHHILDVRRSGPAHRMALRSEDKLVRLNGMPVTRWSHDVLLEQLRLLSESEFVMTVERRMNNKVVLKNLQTRVRKTKRGIAVAGEVFDIAENQLPVVKDIQVASSAGIDNPCQCMISSGDSKKFMSIKGHRLKMLTKKDNDTFQFSRHLFNCTSQSPTSPSSKKPPSPMFVVVISGWINVTTAAYITVVGRNQLSVMTTSLLGTAKRFFSKWSSTRKKSKQIQNSDLRSNTWDKSTLPDTSLLNLHNIDEKYYSIKVDKISLMMFSHDEDLNMWTCSISVSFEFNKICDKHLSRSIRTSEDCAYEILPLLYSQHRNYLHTMVFHHISQKGANMVRKAVLCFRVVLVGWDHMHLVFSQNVFFWKA